MGAFFTSEEWVRVGIMPGPGQNLNWENLARKTKARTYRKTRLAARLDKMRRNIKESTCVQQLFSLKYHLRHSKKTSQLTEKKEISSRQI